MVWKIGQTSLVEKELTTLKHTFPPQFYILQVASFDNLLPFKKAPTITYQAKETYYFTAVLELGDMFDGGGVPIDHYIIQWDTVGNSRPHSQF